MAVRALCFYLYFSRRAGSGDCAQYRRPDEETKVKSTHDVYDNTWKCGELDPFTTGNPFLGTKLLGFRIGRGSGALKGLSFIFRPHPPENWR